MVSVVDDQNRHEIRTMFQWFDFSLCTVPQVLLPESWVFCPKNFTIFQNWWGEGGVQPPSPPGSYTYDHMDCVELLLKGVLCICLSSKRALMQQLLGPSLVPGYAMLMRPNKPKTAVHGCHCLGDMAVLMHKVLAMLRSCVVWHIAFKIVFLFTTSVLVVAHS